MSRNEGPPDWMTEGVHSERQATGSRVQPQSYIKSSLPPRSAENTWPQQNNVPPELTNTFPSSVVTGVKIIAWLMLLNTCIGAAFIMVSLIPPEGNEVLGTFSSRSGTTVTLADYFTFGRVAISTIAGVLLAIMIWKAVDQGD